MLRYVDDMVSHMVHYGPFRKGDSLINGVPQTIDRLRSLGKRIFFVTNNSTKSRKGYLHKFQKLGLQVAAEG